MVENTLSFSHNIHRAHLRYSLRKRIRETSGDDRRALLRRFGEQIRIIAPLVGRAANVKSNDIAGAIEVASPQGIIVGGWLDMDPTNPNWPGRDRLFVIRHEDLVNVCSALASLGFFPPNKVAELIEHIDNTGRRAVAPGLEAPGAPADEIPDLMWDSAIESARNKRRWRDAVAEPDAVWIDPAWRASPAAWRTCGIFAATDAAAEKCRSLPMRDGEAPAGLVVILKAATATAQTHADDWRANGWATAVINADDLLNLYETLTTAVLDKPLAIILGIGRSVSGRHFSRTVIRRREAGLLGELSDDQFNELMGESLKL